MSTHGSRKHRVALEARPDQSIRLRWYASGKKNRITIPGLRLKDSHGLDRLSDIQTAQKLAMECSHALQRGEDPMLTVLAAMTPEPVILKSSSLGIVCEQFFRDAATFLSDDGLVNYRGMATRLRATLGDDFDLETLDVRTVDFLTKSYSETFIADSDEAEAESDDSKPRVRGGPVHLEKSISLLFRIARWAAERRIVSRLAVRPFDLKARVSAAWAKAAGSVPSVQQPGYALKESAALLKNVGKADPRLTLMVEVAFGTRLGQTRLAMRSMLDLDDLEVGAGVLIVPDGSLKKRGVRIDLSDRAETAVQVALGSWLYEFETAYRKGILRDYPLFPAGAFKDIGLSNENSRTSCLPEQHLGTLWDQYEAAAGVPKVEGRRWYGLRRRFRTIAAEFTHDPRVLDRLMGHNTRGIGGRYEDRNDPAVRRAAMDIRESVWTKITTHKEKA